MYFMCVCTAATESESCAVEGSIRPRHNVTSYQLLQVCLLGQWRYVCHYGFNNIVLNVVLHQLGYTGGGACMNNNIFDVIIVNFLSPIKMSAFKLGSIYQPAFIFKFACIGVERRLIDCPIKFVLDQYGCMPANISVNNGNNHETMKLVTVICCYD